MGALVFSSCLTDPANGCVRILTAILFVAPLRLQNGRFAFRHTLLPRALLWFGAADPDTYPFSLATPTGYPWTNLEVGSFYHLIIKHINTVSGVVLVDAWSSLC